VDEAANPIRLLDNGGHDVYREPVAAEVLPQQLGISSNDVEPYLFDEV
jgi:hypothetical protein